MEKFKYPDINPLRIEMSDECRVYKGLEGICVKESRICYIDGKGSRLYYRGYNIMDLVEHSKYEEVVYLLLFGELPSREELESFERKLASKRRLPDGLRGLIRSLPKDSDPMDFLRTTVSAMSLFDDGGDETEKGIGLIAKAPVMLAEFHRYRSGLEPIEPREELSQAGNFLYMMFGKVPEESEERVMDRAFLLLADHGLCASTFASLVTASTLADIYASITTAIGTLAGPLHGGANLQVLKMLEEVGSPDRAESYVEGMLKSGKRIWGFGHRVYKNFDPRYRAFKRMAREMAELRGRMDLFETAERVEEAALKRLAHKNIYPNVDFYSGLVYYFLGIPQDLAITMFAISRMAGWVAHILEYWEQNRLIRPKAKYVGELDKKYIPIEER